MERRIHSSKLAGLVPAALEDSTEAAARPVRQETLSSSDRAEMLFWKG